VPQKPDLTISNVVPGAVTMNTDGSYNVTASYTVTNVGGVATPRTAIVGAYLSSNGVLDTASRTLLGAYAVPAGLQPSSSVTVTTSFRTAPSIGATTTWPAVPAGNYTLFLKVDSVGGPTSWVNGYPCEGGGAYTGRCTIHYTSGSTGGDVNSVGLVPEESETNNAGSAPISF
jgi:hypothetical protein